MDNCTNMLWIHMCKKAQTTIYTSFAPSKHTPAAHLSCARQICKQISAQWHFSLPQNAFTSEKESHFTFREDKEDIPAVRLRQLSLEHLNRLFTRQNKRVHEQLDPLLLVSRCRYKELEDLCRKSTAIATLNILPDFCIPIPNADAFLSLCTATMKKVCVYVWLSLSLQVYDKPPKATLSEAKVP